MTALYVVLTVLGVILLLLTVLSLLRVHFMLSYYGKRPGFGIRVAFLKFDNFLEGVDLEGEAEQLKLEKKQKHKKVKGEKEKKSKGLPDIGEALNVIKDGLSLLLRHFSRYARLDKYRVRINLATDDPAKTAILYGSLAGVVGALHEYAASIKKRSYREGDLYTEYKPDFYAEKTDVAIDINFSLLVWQILVCAFIGYRSYKKFKKLPPKAAKKKGENEQ